MTDTTPRLFDTWVSLSEEPSLAPAYMLGVSGCRRRCCFCHARDEWMTVQGEVIDQQGLAAHFAAAVDAGCRSIQFTGGEPADHLTALVGRLPLPAPLPLTLNSSRPELLAARPELLTPFDTVIVSLKFGNDRCAKRLCSEANYLRTTRDGVWGLARLDVPLRVRHLVMPSHLDCCLKETLDWLSTTVPSVPVTLLMGFVPPRDATDDALARTLTEQERNMALALARESGVDFDVVGQSIPEAGHGGGGPESFAIVIDPAGAICLPTVGAAATEFGRRLLETEMEEQP